MRIEKDRILLEKPQLTTQELEEIATKGDIREIVHTPSYEVLARLRGKTRWYTPKLKIDSGDNLSTPVLFRRKEDSLANSEFPVPKNGVGPYKFRTIDEIRRFIDGGSAYGLIRLVKLYGDTLRSPQAEEDIILGNHPKIVLLTPHESVGFLFEPHASALPAEFYLSIQQAIENGRPIFFPDRRSLLEDKLIDLREDHRSRSKFLKGYVQGARLPIGKGMDLQPEAFSIVRPKRPQTINGIATYVLERSVDVATKGLRDEKLAELTERLGREAYVRGLRVAPIEFRDGRRVQYSYKGQFYAESGNQPEPLDLYKFMTLRGNDLGEVTHQLFVEAVRQSAQFLRLANGIISPKELEYIKKVNGFAGSPNYVTEIRQRYDIEDPQFAEAYGSTIGFLKQLLMQKFGGIATDRYTKNFIVQEFTEKPQGLGRTTEPHIWIIDYDKLQHDLAQRDIVKLLFAPNNGFNGQQIKHFLDLYFAELGFKPEDKMAYDAGVAIANFERNYSWARNLIDKSAANSNNSIELESSLREAGYHHKLGVSAGEELDDMLATRFTDTLHPFTYVKKTLREGAYSKVDAVLNSKIAKGVIKAGEKATMYDAFESGKNQSF